MDQHTDGRGAATFFAAAERAEPEEVQAARLKFLEDRISTAVLDGIPDPVLVVNAERQIIACNASFMAVVGATEIEEFLGKRPGEAAHCVHCQEMPGGCGTGPSCAQCGAVNAIVECLRSHQASARECRLRTAGQADGGVLDLLVRASFVTAGEHELAVVALRDISAEKRRRVLEHVFFHDVLNTVSGVMSIAELLNEHAISADEEALYKQELARLSGQIAEEISAQRQLLAAERGDLQVKRSPVSLPEFMAELISIVRHHSVARDRNLQLGPAPAVSLNTDNSLLRRVLWNLIANALEATPDGGTVTVSVENRGTEVVFSVANPGAIPEDVQRQIFQRSFSTKAGEGRGIGTHSVRLLTERYLGGRVGFTSTDADGTVFTVTLPTG